MVYPTRPVNAYLLALVDNRLMRVAPEDKENLPEGSKVWKVGERVDLHFQQDGYHLVDKEGAYSLYFPFQLKMEYCALPRWSLESSGNDWRIA